MKDHARVVIIGGGIFGVSIAYHLAKLGWTDLIVVEKDEVASGETGHAAGLITQFATSETLLQFRKYSIELYSSLGLVEHVGSVRVASSLYQLKELQRSVSRAKAIGMQVEVISPQEALDLMPQMDAENLYGAIYLPQDGHLDPYITTTTMARHVRDMGGTISTGVRVTGIELSPKGEVQRVLTDHGPIKTEIVVNAAGLWGPQVAAMAGVPLPTTPVDHQHIALKAVPGSEFAHQTPCLRDPDNLVYMREEAGGLVIGGYEPNPAARWIDGVPWEHGGRSLPPDYDRFEQLLEGAIRRFPFLEKAEIISLICHPGAYTPDCQPLLGPVPGARGLWMACGMSLNGFGAAGGVGKVMAEWLSGEEASLDVYGFRATRFGKYYTSPIYAAERTRESVKYYYRLKFPSDENEWARPHRISPLHYRLQEHGAVFGEKYGWERVNYFQPGKPWRRAGADQHQWGWAKSPYFDRVGEEHRATRERVTLFDLTSFGKIEVSGRGALSLLQRLADNDLDQPIGSVMYTQFLNSQGGVIADLTITRLAEDNFQVITGSSFISNDLAWIRMNHRSQDEPVVVRDLTMEWACLALWGPKARQVLTAVSSSDVSNQAIPYLTAAWIDVGGAQVLAQRVSYAGELGWELYVTPERATQVWDALLAAGQEHGMEVGGYKALDSLRLEKGYRYFSADVTPLEDPYSAGLGFCVKLDKGDFIGREALIAIKESGLKQKLSTLVLEGEDYVPVYGGEAVYSNGQVVSRVRSGGYGHTLRRNIILAYLPLEMAKTGNQFTVEVFDQRLTAEVTKPVIFDPSNQRLKA
ncbi:MAG: FAD-dependent oxidoreductase [Anaerolineales bacterium]|nr:FAD-dependent oxidoreductase [Anaerolineales bacterium]